MRIQNNNSANNALRQYGANNTSLGKNLEKLSSGYRINRAGDDAAGLAISEKMRSQITGLEKATDNANDGISLVQTAEGALTEVHSMLNRMTELATQSANGTFDNETDRANLQEEVDSLLSEIDRISESTNYNGINLLDGSISSKNVTLKSAANGEKEVLLDVGSTGITIPAGREDATPYTYQMGAITGAADDDKLKIDFTADGKSYSLTLSAPVAADMSIANVANVINSGTNGALAFNDDAPTREALAAFKENFTINATGLITAKTEGTANSASISAMNITGTGAIAAGTIAPATDAGYTLDLSGTIAPGTLKLGDKSIEIKGTDGQTEILGKLVDAGITASVKAGNIFVTENDAIKTTQTGTGISSSNTSLVATSDKASAASFSISSTAASGAAAARKLTINYVDADGNAKTKELEYTSSNVDEDANNTAIKNAIDADDELKELFSVSVDTAADTITLTSKIKGENGAVLKGMTTDDTTAGVLGKMTVTKGEDKGTILSFGEDSTGTKATFKAGDTIKIDGKTYEFTDGTTASGKGNVAVALGTDTKGTFDNLQSALEKNGIASKVSGTGANATLEIADTAASNKRGEGGLKLQIGDTAESFNQISVAVDSMSSKSLGIDGIDISSQGGAEAAVEKIKSAINTVSGTRGKLGAVQNRLERTINNLSVATENATEAESRIRDVDMAKEMTEYTQNNILTQASQAMLAQANQLPQGVLQLLQ